MRRIVRKCGGNGKKENEMFLFWKYLERYMELSV